MDKPINMSVECRPPVSVLLVGVQEPAHQQHRQTPPQTPRSASSPAKPFTVLVDTRSVLSFIGPIIVQYLEETGIIGQNSRWPPTRVIDDRTVDISKAYQVEVQLEEKIRRHQYLHILKTCKVLLGMDFLLNTFIKILFHV